MKYKCGRGSTDTVTNTRAATTIPPPPFPPPPPHCHCHFGCFLVHRNKNGFAKQTNQPHMPSSIVVSSLLLLVGLSISTDCESGSPSQSVAILLLTVCGREHVALSQIEVSLPSQWGRAGQGRAGRQLMGVYVLGFFSVFLCFFVSPAFHRWSVKGKGRR